MKHNKIFLIIFTMLLMIPTLVFASGSIRVSTGSLNITKGGSKTFYITANNAAGRVDISSKNGSVASISKSSVFLDNDSASITVNGKQAGSTTIVVNVSDAATYDGEELSNTYSINVNVQNPVVPKKAATDNYLKSLSIEGCNISPDFDASTYSYSVNLPYDTTKINISADAKDSSAKISGIGEKEVSPEGGTYEIVVTGKSGEKRTYKISATVDSAPINVKVDNNDYTVIKSKESLPSLDIEHEDATLTIEDQEVPAYRIAKLNYMLVALQDSEGNVELFKFTSEKMEENFKYELVKFLKVNNIELIYLDFDKEKIPAGYKKYTIKINDKKYEVYKNDKNSKYSLIYGKNINTGKTNIYQYDEEENTIQKYNVEENNKINMTNKYLLIITLLSSICLMLMMSMLLLIHKVNKKKKKEIK